MGTRFWVKREKAIVQNGNSTNSIELPHCGPLRLKMRDLVTDLQIWVKTEQVLYPLTLAKLTVSQLELLQAQMESLQFY